MDVMTQNSEQVLQDVFDRSGETIARQVRRGGDFVLISVSVFT